MRGAALADLHLGFRAFSDVTEGRNTREVDTEKAWMAAVHLIVNDDPDLVTIAGDVFHHPRVSDYAKRVFLVGIRTILEETMAHIIILQGNHDAGRTAEVLTPIALAEGWSSRVHIVTEPQRVTFNLESDWITKVAVACFPFVVGGGDTTYKLEPDPHADMNVLLMHAAVKGSSEGDRLPYFYGSADQALNIGREADRWDVIACGDFHEFTRLHPERLAFYSGSLERTSNNIWAEDEPKGVVFYDTTTGEMELAEVPNRDMKDINFREFEETLDADGLNIALACLVEEDQGWELWTKDCLVRLKVEDFPRSDREHIDWATVRKLKDICTHFYLDIRYAAPDLGDIQARDGKKLSLAEELVTFMADDPEDVRDLAVHYLDIHAEVEDAEEEVAP